VVALLGLVAVLAGLLVPTAPRHWDEVGGAVQNGVLVATGMLVVAVFRPDRGRAVDLGGAAVEQVVAWSTVAMAADRAMSATGAWGAGAFLVTAGACLLVTGASWDLAAAWRGSATVPEPRVAERRSTAAPADPVG
jgi:hypothetical protein